MFAYRIFLWWRHDMEELFMFLALCEGTGNAGFDVFFEINLNKLLKKHRVVGDLRHHEAHLSPLRILLSHIVACW